MSADNFVPVSLDTNLDDIADLPEFRPLPNGAYLVELEEGIVQKTVNEHASLEAKLVVKEVLECDEKSLDEKLGEKMPKAGDSTTLLFSLDNEIGAGMLKKFLKPLAEGLGYQKVGEVVENSRGLQVMVVLTRQWNKEKERYFQRFVTVALPD